MTNQQLTNFTFEQIKAKAHQIWLARQETEEAGDPDSDWQAAVKALSDEINGLPTKNLPLTRWVGLAALLSIVAIVAVLATLRLI